MQVQPSVDFTLVSRDNNVVMSESYRMAYKASHCQIIFKNRIVVLKYRIKSY